MKHADTKVLALIPARSGSTGVRNKNVANFCGRPLIYYTIKEAQKSGLFDRIIVSTNSENIARISRAFGAEVPYLRPSKLATGKANVVDAVLHMLEYLRTKEGYEPDSIVLLQPTSPLRDFGDILRSFAQFKKEGAPALTSVCKTHHGIFHIAHNRLKLINSDIGALINRQERPTTYKQDGSMIYIVDVKYFKKHKTFMPSGKTAAYIVPNWKAVDIDDPEDFELAEVLYKNRRVFKSV